MKILVNKQKCPQNHVCPSIKAVSYTHLKMDGGAKWEADVAHSHPAGCGRRHRGIFDVAAICKGTGGTGL